MTENDKPTGYVTLPYVSGITDALRRILQKHNIRVTTKPLRTLQQTFPSPKYQVPPEQRTNVIYNIPCLDCLWSYVGETGRSFETQKKGTYSEGSNIANHAWKNNHNIDFANGKVIDSSNYHTQKTESWHTAFIVNSDNTLLLSTSIVFANCFLPHSFSIQHAPINIYTPLIYVTLACRRLQLGSQKLVYLINLVRECVSKLKTS